MAVLRWEDGLAILWLSTRDPKEGLFQLRKTGEHTFRLVRKDDEEALGQEFVFEVDDDGAVTRYKTHSNWYLKVR